MSTPKTGDIAEAAVVEEYRSKGYDVYVVKNSSEQGLDVIATREHDGHRQTVFIEVKANRQGLKGQQREGGPEYVGHKLMEADQGGVAAPDGSYPVARWREENDASYVHYASGQREDMSKAKIVAQASKWNNSRQFNDTELNFDDEDALKEQLEELERNGNQVEHYQINVRVKDGQAGDWKIRKWNSMVERKAEREAARDMRAAGKTPDPAPDLPVDPWGPKEPPPKWKTAAGEPNLDADAPTPRPGSTGKP